MIKIVCNSPATADGVKRKITPLVCKTHDPEILKFADEGELLKESDESELMKIEGSEVIIDAKLTDIPVACKTLIAIRRLNNALGKGIISVRGNSDELLLTWPLPEVFQEYVTLLTDAYKEFGILDSNITLEQQLYDFIWCFSYYDKKDLTKMLAKVEPDYLKKMFPACKNLPPNALPADRLIFSVNDRLDICSSFYLN